MLLTDFLLSLFTDKKRLLIYGFYFTIRQGFRKIMCQFINILRAAFARLDPESKKKIDNLTVFFCTFAICGCKSCSKNVDEIDPMRYVSWKRKIAILAQIKLEFRFPLLLLVFPCFLVPE